MQNSFSDVPKIVHFVRDENKVPFGVVVATSPVNIGFAELHRKKDRWNRRLGTIIATGRALKGSNRVMPVHKETLVVIDKVRKLAHKYFKDYVPV